MECTSSTATALAPAAGLNYPVYARRAGDHTVSPPVPVELVALGVLGNVARWPPQAVEIQTLRFARTGPGTLHQVGRPTGSEYVVPGAQAVCAVDVEFARSVGQAAGHILFSSDSKDGQGLGAAGDISTPVLVR